MPRLPKISRHFLTAVSRVHSAKNTKQRKGPGKSRLFFTLKKKAKSWKNSRNVSFQLFRDSWDINITEESWFTLCRRQILKTSGFSWGKGALFLGFRNGEWKLKKGYPFFSFECEIQINTLIFRHFSFSLSAFFAKSRIAGTDHWFLCGLFISLPFGNKFFHCKYFFFSDKNFIFINDRSWACTWDRQARSRVTNVWWITVISLLQRWPLTC